MEVMKVIEGDVNPNLTPAKDVYNKLLYFPNILFHFTYSVSALLS